MAYKCISKEWNETLKQYGCQFVCDSTEDIAKLPKCLPGSTAIVVIEGSPVYMVNASGEWKVV